MSNNKDTENTTNANSSNNGKSMRELEVGALWLKKSKAGANFLSGYFLDESKNKVNIVLFKNNFKKPGESSPDYRMYLSEQQSAKIAVSAQSIDQNHSNDQSDSDDIPF